MTKEDILAGLRRLPVEFPVVVEGRTITLHLLPFSARARTEFQLEHRAAGEAGKAELYARLFVRSVCYPNGCLMFRGEDLAAANELDGQVLERVALRVIELNGLGEDDAGKAPSPGGPSSSSPAGSDSPSVAPSPRSSS
jgi:hypothetical protein